MLAAPMPRLHSALRRFLADERGATAVEYGLIAALMVVVIIAAILSVGTELRDNFYTKIAGAFS